MCNGCNKFSYSTDNFTPIVCLFENREECFGELKWRSKNERGHMLSYCIVYWLLRLWSSSNPSCGLSWRFRLLVEKKYNVEICEEYTKMFLE